MPSCRRVWQKPQRFADDVASCRYRSSFKSCEQFGELPVEDPCWLVPSHPSRAKDGNASKSSRSMERFAIRCCRMRSSHLALLVGERAGHRSPVDGLVDPLLGLSEERTFIMAACLTIEMMSTSALS